MTSREHDSATGLFACACEEMNELARSLSTMADFGDIRTGADIRSYTSGWRLEKWIEAQLNRSTGTWAAWWLEFGPDRDGWIVESHVAVGPDGLHVDLETRSAQSVEELAGSLSEALACLRRALNERGEFAREVARSIAGDSD